MIKDVCQDAEPDNQLSFNLDCDICGACGEHAEFEDDGSGHLVSNCCGSPVYNVDEDYGRER